MTGVSGVFTSQLSGTVITGDTVQVTEITGVSGVFTSQLSGSTITGDTVLASTLTGVSGVFTHITGSTGEFNTLTGVTIVGTTSISGETVTGTTANFTSGVFEFLTAANQSFSSGVVSGTLTVGSDLYVSGSGYFSSGISVTGEVTSPSGIFTTVVSGATVTGDTLNATTGLVQVLNVVSGVFASGTVTNPSVTFTGDSDTGAYSNAPNNFSISVGGSSGITISSGVSGMVLTIWAP